MTGRVEVSTDRHMQIGEVAERTELSIKTIRHYDEVGLVTPSERSAGGFRLYTDADVQRLLVIRRMKPLGFTLDEMRQLLDSLDILDTTGSGHDRVAAQAFVTDCHTRAEESCRKLRKQVAYAEELTALLADHAAGETAAAAVVDEP
ncbi:MerR family transcriptional regulator [Rhodococcus opacus]|uniref:Putative MerR family transcriptional regulator n=1 Tax=Rhodococcus opacus (strain B4) TaxID=632772 RepID=C1AS22_RHOOB|nr:MerR family transcriptional regulator [Rhodococcus opacus]MDV6247428.1 MerR family transcriptional regulator [Rhodococcus opacus]BAH48271.1 putative MerR family transcriptional regulator [Rhodococcus opacus B4]